MVLNAYAYKKKINKITIRKAAKSFIGRKFVILTLVTQ